MMYMEQLIDAILWEARYQTYISFLGSYQNALFMLPSDAYNIVQRKDYIAYMMR